MTGEEPNIPEYIIKENYNLTLKLCAIKVEIKNINNLTNILKKDNFFFVKPRFKIVCDYDDKHKLMILKQELTYQDYLDNKWDKNLTNLIKQENLEIVEKEVFIGYE